MAKKISEVLADSQLDHIRETWLARGPKPWWRETDVERTREFQALALNVKVLAPTFLLTPADIARNPLVWDEVNRYTEVCEKCVQGKTPPGCPQRLIRDRIANAYPALKETSYGEGDEKRVRREFTMRQCRGPQARQLELEQAWGVPMQRGPFKGIEVPAEVAL